MPSQDPKPTRRSTELIFGGPWSLIKADLVEKYLRFFNTALKNQNFERVYIDAFAGSGTFSYVDEAPLPDLFGPRDEQQDVHAGSALRALRVDPPFHRIIFIEKQKQNVVALQKVIDETGSSAARVERGDANDVLRALCRPGGWKDRRGVIFLDPFGMKVEWNTLQLIAATRALDVWLLFPLSGLIRNLPLSAKRLDAGKHAAVSRVLGTDAWFEEFYKPQPTLWGAGESPSEARRAATVDQIEGYVKNRLKEIFPHVEAPKRMARGNQPLFSLFFAVSNPSPGAISLARKGASHILKRA